MEPASIAIWRKNVIVVALAFTVWGANVSCLSQGKSLSYAPSARVREIAY